MDVKHNDYYFHERLKRCGRDRTALYGRKRPHPRYKKRIRQAGRNGIEYYEQTMRKLYEAKQINEGLSGLANGKTVDGDAVKQRLAAKYGI